ncbi:NAD(P)/FAD-dependent oxidoreductase [Pseudomonas bijieensis]
MYTAQDSSLFKQNTDHPPFPDIASLWQSTANNGPKLPTLMKELQYDVAIIGGGYTGMSTARYLAAKGLSPVILEASRIGWGASGRNGGVVEGKYRVSFSDVADHFGLDTSRCMYNLAHEAVDHVAELIEAYSISAANYQQNGTMRCAHHKTAFATLVREDEWVRKFLSDKSTRIISAEEMAHETGSRDFVGGVLNSHGGTIHPLNFARGIAAGLVGNGVDIFEESPAVSFHTHANGVKVFTPGGVINASQIVIATDAYTDITKATSAVARTIVPFRSAIIATEPLDEVGMETPIFDGRSYSETRRMMRWFRRSGNRLLYGGRGAFGKTDSEAAFRALELAFHKQFPQLGNVKISHRWSGLVALTLDAVPHLGRLNSRTTYAMGYNGLGVAMSSNMGKYVAEVVTGGNPSLGMLTASDLKSIPLYSLREPGVRMVAGWYQLLDRLGY